MEISDELVEIAAKADCAYSDAIMGWGDTWPAKDEDANEYRGAARASLTAALPVALAAELRAQASYILTRTKTEDLHPRATLALVAEYRRLRERADELKARVAE